MAKKKKAKKKAKVKARRKRMAGCPKGSAFNVRGAATAPTFSKGCGG